MISYRAFFESSEAQGKLRFKVFELCFQKKQLDTEKNLETRLLNFVISTIDTKNKFESSYYPFV